MPNWCENVLLIDGNEKELVRFSSKVKTSKQAISFEKLLPTPKELLGVKKDLVFDNELLDEKNKRLIEKYGATDWYDWRILKWGTKCDAVQVETLKNKKYLCYRFYTAWNPPFRFLETASKRWKKLRFVNIYFEPGLAFAGIFITKDGNLIDIYCDSAVNSENYSTLERIFTNSSSMKDIIEGINEYLPIYKYIG